MNVLLTAIVAKHRIFQALRTEHLPRLSVQPSYPAMPSFRNIVGVVAAAFVVSVQADYYINPDSVSQTDRKYWCQSELSTCPIICSQTTEGKPITNTCDPVSASPENPAHDVSRETD